MRRAWAHMAVAVALPGILAGPAGATFPGATGQIAFQTDRDGSYAIYVMDPDGSDARVLFDLPGSHEFNPAWSLSGLYVVLETQPLNRSTSDIVIVDVLTGEAAPLLDGPENDFAAQFCDTDTIVFTRQTDPANADIWQVDTDGTNLQQLTDAPGRQTFPTCSPNSKLIAYNSNQTGVPAIWEMNADGTGQHQIAVGVDPDYSPDWKTVTYAGPASGNLEILELERETGQTTQLTDTASPIQNRFPRYAPDYPGGPIELYYTQIDPRLANPEQMRAVTGEPTDQFTTLCGDRPPTPAPPPPAPGNNSAPAAQPAVGCRLDSNGDLTIEGTNGPDRMDVSEAADRTITVAVNGSEKTYPAGSVKSIRILGRRGNDRISKFQVSVPVTADGGEGLDIVFGEVTIEGTAAKADRVQIRTIRDDDEEDYGTTITVNGETTSLGTPVIVKLEGFDDKDTVVTDRSTRLEVHGWLFIDPVREPRQPDPVITVNGTPEDDDISIKLDQSATFRIARNGQPAPGITGIFGLVRTDVAGGGGDDEIDTNIRYNRLNRLNPRLAGGPPMPVRIQGGPGNDVVTCRGAAQTCTVLAGPGNDTVDVRDGTRSVVDGGPGSDRVIADRADRVRRAETVIRG